MTGDLAGHPGIPNTPAGVARVLQAEADAARAAMTEDQARGLQADLAHDIKVLSRKTRVELVKINTAELAAVGQLVLHGGPATRDELLADILIRRYPLAERNEATHVLYHTESAGWSSCNHCHPHDGGRCDCDLGRAHGAHDGPCLRCDGGLR